jgi:excisionase family DNA binding protein
MSEESPTAADLVAHPERIPDVAPIQIPTILAQLATVTAAVAARGALRPTQSAGSEQADRLLTVPEAAKRLQFGIAYVYELVRRQRLPAIREGKYVRISERTLSAWIKSHEAGLDESTYDRYSQPHDNRAPRAKKRSGRHTSDLAEKIRQRQYTSPVRARRVEDPGTRGAANEMPSREADSNP